MAGIREGEKDPEQGKWGRDEKGRLNGRVYENATRFFYDVQPKPDYTEKKETIRLAMQEALACGLTAVHTEDLRYVESLSELIRIYRELREEGVWLRTHQLIYHPYLEELKESSWNAGDGDEWFRIGAMKIFADGSLGGKTALLSRPYRDEPDHYGLLIHEPGELIRLTQTAAEQRMPVAAPRHWRSSRRICVEGHAVLSGGSRQNRPHASPSAHSRTIFAAGSHFETENHAGGCGHPAPVCGQRFSLGVGPRRRRFDGVCLCLENIASIRCSPGRRKRCADRAASSGVGTSCGGHPAVTGRRSSGLFPPAEAELDRSFSLIF